MNSKHIILIIFFNFIIINTFAQCCAAGNPDSDNTFNSNGGKNLLSVSVLYNHSYSDTYYDGIEKLDFKYIDFSYFDFTSITFSYGVTNRLKLSADLGYFYSKGQSFIPTSSRNTYSRIANGLGDISFSMVYNLYKTDKNYFSFYPLAKLTFPIGQFDQEVNNVILPIDLQPSSGSYKYSFGLLVKKSFKNEKLSFFGLGSFEFSQRINTERTNYKYGNLYNLSLISSYKIYDGLYIKLQIKNQIRKRALDKNNVLINATGGYVIFLSPQIDYRYKKSWVISAFFEEPIYKNMNGRQLTNKYSYTIKFSKNINTAKVSNSDTIDAKILETAPEISFFVNGLCDMCKDRIESTALNVDGVIWASWNKETKILTVKYMEEFSQDKLKKAIAKAGHDNDSYKASNKAYKKLHSCCKYRG